MTREDGFAVMDVSTSICDDPKFRRLQRQNPEQVATAFAVYVSVCAESWRSARRIRADHAWPSFLAFDQAVIDALVSVGLLDRGGLIPSKAWRGWFAPAFERRRKARERWRRYNAERERNTTVEPRGSDVDTATSVPSVRSSSPSVPPEGSTTPLEETNQSRPVRLVHPERAV